jgi:hypothetical protein
MKYALCLLSLALLLSLTVVEAVNKPVSHKATVSKRSTTPSVAPILTDFTFRGNHIGDPAEEVILRSIKVNQLGDPSDKYSYNQQSAIDYCISHLVDQGESSCSDSNSDLRVINQHSSSAIINYQFWDKKFYSFWLSFNGFLFDDMKALLIAKYGRPHKIRVEKVQNLMGAEIDQLLLR